MKCFERGSWQHAVDDFLVDYGKTSQEFATPHDAVRWLVQITGDAALTCHGIGDQEAAEHCKGHPMTLTEEETAKIIRIIESASHLLSAIPRDPELNESLAEQVRELEEARKILKGKMK